MCATGVNINNNFPSLIRWFCYIQCCVLCTVYTTTKRLCAYTHGILFFRLYFLLLFYSFFMSWVRCFGHRVSQCIYSRQKRNQAKRMWMKKRERNVLILVFVLFAALICVMDQRHIDSLSHSHSVCTPILCTRWVAEHRTGMQTNVCVRMTIVSKANVPLLFVLYFVRAHSES